MHEPVICHSCGKRCFTSVDAARRAFRRAGFRLRIYWCLGGCAWHVCNGEKR